MDNTISYFAPIIGINHYISKGRILCPQLVSITTIQKSRYFSNSFSLGFTDVAKKYLMDLGTRMSRNLFNVVPRAFVILDLEKGNKECNLFLNICFFFLRMLAKVLVQLFVPHVLQHHFRHGSDSSGCQVTLVFLQHA